MTRVSGLDQALGEVERLIEQSKLFLLEDFWSPPARGVIERLRAAAAPAIAELPRTWELSWSERAAAMHREGFTLPVQIEDAHAAHSATGTLHLADLKEMMARAALCTFDCACSVADFQDKAAAIFDPESPRPSLVRRKAENGLWLMATHFEVTAEVVRIARSISRCGLINPLQIDPANNALRCGTQRVAALWLLDWAPQIPVVHTSSERGLTLEQIARGMFARLAAPVT